MGSWKAANSPYRHLPNCITALRIIATAVLLFISPFTAAFYVVYTLAGVSDVLDGWLARRLKLTSEFGAKLDSAADLLFYAVMIIRIFPVLWDVLPRVIWIGVAAVVLVRIVCYLFVAVKHHRFASLHTYMNKITGALVFALPYVIKTPIAPPYCWILCAVSSAGTLEEFAIHIRSKEYDGHRQSLAEK